MPDVLIQGRDGFFSGYRAPARSGKGPGIVLLQEIFGVNRVMRDIADWLAGEGYTVICPDLFWRQEPNIQLNEFTQAEWDKAFALYGGFNEAKGADDIRPHARGDGLLLDFRKGIGRADRHPASALGSVPRGAPWDRRGAPRGGRVGVRDPR